MHNHKKRRGKSDLDQLVCWPNTVGWQRFKELSKIDLMY